MQFPPLQPHIIGHYSVRPNKIEIGERFRRLQNFETNIYKDIKTAICSLGYKEDDIILSIAKEGIPYDICTAVACQLSSKYRKEGAFEIASKLAKSLEKNPYISSIKPEKNGFINIGLAPKAFEEYYSSLLNPTEKKKGKS